MKKLFLLPVLLLITFTLSIQFVNAQGYLNLLKRNRTTESKGCIITIKDVNREFQYYKAKSLFEPGITQRETLLPLLDTTVEITVSYQKYIPGPSFCPDCPPEPGIYVPYDIKKKVYVGVTGMETVYIYVTDDGKDFVISYDGDRLLPPIYEEIR